MKKLLAMSLILTLILSITVFHGAGARAADAGYKIGSVVTFGSYEQDGDKANGREPVEWIVVDKRGDGSLVLISRYALDAKPYNEEFTVVTWENCTLRKWLNEEFYASAFSAREQSLIVPVTLQNEDNPYYGTDGGNDTTDKVWLLSINEATDYFGNDKVFSYFTDDESRLCGPTVYAARAQTVRQGGDYVFEPASPCVWWLRSPGDYAGCASYVLYDGFVIFVGCDVDDVGDDFGSADCFVRPAVVVRVS